MQFLKNLFIAVRTILNYIFIISKTYLIQKLNKAKGSASKIYLISYQNLNSKKYWYLQKIMFVGLEEF